MSQSFCIFYLLEGMQNLGFAFQNFCFTTYKVEDKFN